MLLERTLDTIALLDALDLFHAVGAPLTENVARVKSWPQALKIRSTGRSLKWEMDTWGDMYMAYPQPVADFMPRLNEISRLTRNITSQKIHPLEAQDKLFRPLWRMVSGDFLSIVTASEIADLISAASLEHYAGMLAWYARGYFPCGWREDVYPKGRQAIY